MRDARFHQDAYHAQLGRRRISAESLHIDASALAIVEDALRQAWGESLKVEAPTREVFLVCFVEQAKDIRPEVGRLVDATHNLFGQASEDDDVWENRAAIVAGHVLGQCLASGSAEPSLFDRAHEVVGHGHLGSIALDEALVRSCLQEPESLSRWSAALAAVPRDGASYVESYGRNEYAGLREGDIQCPAELWTHHSGFVPLNHTVPHRLRILAELSLSAFLNALESIPSHTIRGEVLGYLRLYEDRDWLVRAIREAPLAYDKDSWTKQASLFYLVGEIVKHGDRLSRAVEGAEQRESGEWTIVAGEHSPSQALADLRAIELKEWFTTAFATLLDRSDGHRVAIAFGAELVGRTASDRGLGRPKKSWDAEDAARDVLIEQIAKAGISGAEMRAAAPIPTASSARRSPLHHLVLSACVDHLRRASTDRCIAATVPDPAAVWSWYGELLHKQDSTLSSHVNPYGPAQPWIFAALGSALLAQPDPAARWLEEWKSLYSQRELARFSPDRYDSLAPSEHLLLVARNASLVKAPGQTKEEDRRLWWAAETELTSLFLSGLLLRTPLEAIGPWNFFVVVPHVMGESWAECVRGSKELFQANDVVTLLSASSLVYNGRDARSVSHVFGEIGCDPVVVGTRLLRWMTDSGEEQKSRIDIPAILSLFQTQTKESKL